MLIVCCILLKHMLWVWFCRDLKKEQKKQNKTKRKKKQLLTKEHIKIFRSCQCTLCELLWGKWSWWLYKQTCLTIFKKKSKMDCLFGFCYTFLYTEITKVIINILFKKKYIYMFTVFSLSHEVDIRIPVMSLMAVLIIFAIWCLQTWEETWISTSQCAWCILASDSSRLNSVSLSLQR